MNSAGHAIHIGIRKARKHRQGKQLSVDLFGHGTQTRTGAETLAVKRMQMDRDIVQLGPNPAFFQ